MRSVEGGAPSCLHGAHASSPAWAAPCMWSTSRPSQATNRSCGMAQHAAWAAQPSNGTSTTHQALRLARCKMLPTATSGGGLTVRRHRLQQQQQQRPPPMQLTPPQLHLHHASRLHQPLPSLLHFPHHHPSNITPLPALLPGHHSPLHAAPPCPNLRPRLSQVSDTTHGSHNTTSSTPTSTRLLVPHQHAQPHGGRELPRTTAWREGAATLMMRWWWTSHVMGPPRMLTVMTLVMIATTASEGRACLILHTMIR